MDQKDFNRLLHAPDAATQVEAQEVLTLKEDFPFSQLLHALSARVAKDHGLSNQQEELQLAAVYASDRNVLKDIVTGNFTPLVSLPETQSAETPEPVEAVEEPPVTVSTVKERKVIEPSGYETSGVAEEVFSDLEKLNQSRHNFEALFDELGKVKETDSVVEPPASPEKKVAEKAEAKKEVKPKKETRPKPPVRKKATGKTKKQRIIELAKKLEGENSPEETTAEKKSLPIKRKKKVAEPGDQLIDEIKTSKKKIQPESNRQKEQIELINQFIKAQPRISPQKSKPDNPSNVDFSLPSSEFGDNIISETLVKILLSQGKKEKAIEVLRKLIWKFPQKKSYFAAQIEELKK